MTRLLFLSRWYPDPPNNGSKLRIFNLLRGLAARHEVTLLTFFDPRETPPGDSGLRDLCTHVEAIPWKPYEASSLHARLGVLSPRPRFVVDTFSARMNLAIRRLLAAQQFDAIIASQLDMAVYGSIFGAVPALFEEVEVATLYEQFSHASSRLARVRYGLTWLKHRQYLRRLLQHFAACTVASEQERNLLVKAVPGYRSVSVLPNCIDVKRYDGVDGEPRENELVFAGSLTYDANYEAMTWFLQHVYPQVQEQVPEVKLIITGDHGHRPLPDACGVTLTGFVDDVRPLVAGASVSVAPILTGGGTRLKILEAMALGTPVVATAKGAEGLSATNGEHLLLADHPQEFARAVVHLLEDPHERRCLAASARRFVRERYNWSSVMPRFLDLVDAIIQGKRVYHA